MIKSDAINNRVLHELIQVARVSNADLAEREGLSASACPLRLEAADLSAYETFHTKILGTVPKSIRLRPMS